MSVFKPIKCISSQLSNIAVIDGQLIFTTDTNEIYLDDNGFRNRYSGGDTNIKINDFNIFYWDGKSSDINPNNIILWQKIYDNRPAIVVCPDLNRTVVFLIEYMNSSGSYYYNSIVPYYSAGTTSYGYSTRIGYQRVSITMSSGKVTAVSTLNNYIAQDIQYLSTHANSYGSFTPTNDMHPTTKKYVDDSIKTAIQGALGGSY